MHRLAGSRIAILVSLSLMLALGASAGSSTSAWATPAAPRSPGPSVMQATDEPAVNLRELSAARAMDAGRVELPRPVRGANAIRLLADQLDEAAALNDVPQARLVELLRRDPSAWLDTDGAVFFTDEVADAPAHEPVSAEAPLDQTFLLHSKPGSQHTIFLDFDGGNASDTAWHASYPTTPTTQPAWDPSGNGAAFDNVELTQIQTVWQSVAEDYAPFDVDVTTADPGAAAIHRASASDAVFGSHVLITPSDAAHDAICGGCGGVAYLGVFDAVNGGGGAGGDGYGYRQPTWVFPQKLGNSAKNIAEAVTHEVGHNFGLFHDGNATEGYDIGHGSWAPIMGVGYYRSITQWSRGDYSGANNSEDDVAKVGSVIGVRADEAGTSSAGAPALPHGTAYIATRTDVDTYLLGACTGSVSVSASARGSFANLDIRLSIIDSAGQLVASADPESAQTSTSVASGMSASLTQTLTSGTYYASVDGVGNGAWSTGYDDYGSLGAYTLAASGCDGAAPAGTPSAPTDTAATSHTSDPAVTVTWAAPASAGTSSVTGYVLTRSGSDTHVQVGPNTTSYSWAGLDSSTSYSFTVTAVNAQGPGPTITVSATTRVGVLRPGAPKNVAASWNSLRQYVPLTYAAPASSGSYPVTSYDILVDGVYTYYTAGNGIGVPALAPGTHTLGVAAVNQAGRGPVVEVTVVVPPRPGNDAYAQRTTLPGVSGSIHGDNLESSAEAEAGEPEPTATRPGAGDASLWYSWTAAATGPMTMTTTSTVADRDTTLGVYTGSGLGALTLVVGNDEPSGASHLAAVHFTATAGTTYAIAVNGYRTFAAGVGQFGLTWSDTATTSGTATSTDQSSVVSASASAPVNVAASPALSSTTPAFPSTTPVTPPSSQAASTMKVVAPRRAKIGSRPVIRVSVLRGSAAATGKVVVIVGKKKTRLTLTGRTAKLRLPKLTRGRLKITVRYLGDATTAPASTRWTIKVKPA